MRSGEKNRFSVYVLMGVLAFSILFLGGKADSQTSISKAVTTGSTVTTISTEKDPINMATGEYFFFMGLFNLGGPLPLTYGMYYGSQVDSKRDITDGFPDLPFSSDHGRFLTVYKTLSPQEAFVETGLGKEIGFTKSGTSWTVSMHERIRYQLRETTDYFYMLDPGNHLVFSYAKVYDSSTLTIAMLVRVEDRNGNAITYTDSGTNQIISDGLGRQLTLSLTQVSGSWYVTQVKDQNNRTYTFSYENSPSDNPGLYTLRSITDPMGNIIRFTYNGNHNMISKRNPAGNTPYAQTYDTTTTRGIVASQADAYGNTSSVTKISYNPYGQRESQFSIAYPDGTSRTFVHDHYSRVMKSNIDPAGKTARFSSDEYSAQTPGRDEVTSVTDRIGDTTSFTYHNETGKLASITNAKGNTITYTFTAQEQTFTNPTNSETQSFTFYNLTGITNPDGTNEQFTYDTKGNMTQRVDRAGKAWSYTYNSKGQVLTATNPTGGVITNTYNTDGTLASSKDSETGTTTYSYDTYKRLTRITHPDNTFIQMNYNLNDRITFITDENNHTYTYGYNLNNNLTKVTDPAGKPTQYAYDLMDRVTQVTDRLNKVSTFAYSNMNRLQSFTDPNNITATYGYDTRDWLNSITLGGKTWNTGYDDEGIVSSRRTPLNYTTTLQSDKLGFTSSITNPLNQMATFTRDNMSRMTGATDPLNRTTNYAYDSRGLLSGVTVPVIGTATYQRNDLGRLSQITDLKGSNWIFGYTNAGRLQSDADPLGNTWQYGYDTLGRLSTITYPGGGTVTRTYDSAGNITRLLYSGGPDLQFTYDSLDRLLTTNNLALTWDDEGRVISTDNPGVIFGATYDNGGRLSTATYPSTGSGQAFTVTYTYNSTTGLLSRVTDNLTSTQVDFTYDNDRRPTGITRSNGVNTTISWDNAGRPIRFQDGPSAGSGFIDLQYTLNGAGEVTQANITVPLDPSSLLQSGTDNFTYDAASRVSTAGYSHDQRGRMTGAPGYTFTWDGASRLTGIGGATLAYNGLGDLITRTESGNTIHHYYNYAIRLNPIVAEKNDSTGQFLRYYVWTPGGRLLYMIDAQDGNKVYFYHFDRTGSTLVLTGSEGTVTDKYAYNSYGRLLSHQGSNPQPFTFVGEMGVRHEGSTTGSAYGTLYHMRARYYDAITQRFISREPLWPRVSDPLRINPYQYSWNNPIRYVDVSGTEPQHSDLFKQELKQTQEEIEKLKTEIKALDEEIKDEERPWEKEILVDKRRELKVRLMGRQAFQEIVSQELERIERERFRGQQLPVIKPSSSINYQVVGPLPGLGITPGERQPVKTPRPFLTEQEYRDLISYSPVQSQREVPRDKPPQVAQNSSEEEGPQSYAELFWLRFFQALLGGAEKHMMSEHHFGFLLR